MTTRELIDEQLDIAICAFNGTQRDRSMWARIAWRIGPEEFKDAVHRKQREDETDSAPRNPAAAFMAFLNRNYPKPESEGGAK